LRAAADAVAIGYSGVGELVPIQSLSYGPRTGPGQAALRSVRAWPVYRRAMQLFCASQWELIVHIILSNWRVRRWCEYRREQGLVVTPAHEMGKLLAILDVLTEHFAAEVEQDLQHGAVV